jgi:enamine deaminase RidA (YjgF/YER057c/UK114 family)
MEFPRSSWSLAAFLFLILNSPPDAAQAQKKPPDPDQGYIPIVAPENAKHKKNQDFTQVLPPTPEPPPAITADSSRLIFEVTPLSAKGLLSQQTRDALKTLLKSKRGRFVKVRAFVAGSGDLRRVGDLMGEMFQEKHVPLPALSVLQVGALPLEGAQVMMEAIEEDNKVQNPNGLVFIAGQGTASVRESLDKIKSLLSTASIQPSDVLSVTCFISSLDDQRDTHETMVASFPSAAIDYVQMQRGPVTPMADCEAVARASTAAIAAPGVLVASSQVVITGTQLAFGDKDSDFTLAFERLAKTLAASRTDLAHVAVEHLYVTGTGLSSRVLALQSAQGDTAHPSANTLFPCESLPSLDAVFGIDAIAVPGWKE